MTAWIYTKYVDFMKGLFIDFGEWIKLSWQDFVDEFKLNFIEGDRWKWLVEGFGNTLLITLLAGLIGIALGVIIAIVRSTYDKMGPDLKKRGGIVYGLLKFFNSICNIYLTVIRGTPVVVQLLIMYFIIFASSTNDIMVAVIAFGINSGAYVAEIFRSGIMSVDKGQFEAGRSLGLNYIQTMIYIVVPQMFKIVLPTLCNEFIVLLKETSVAGYVTIVDLTRAGNLVRNNTYDALNPLLLVALIYLTMVVLLTKLLALAEKKLANA